MKVGKLTTYLEDTEEKISEVGIAQPAVVREGGSKAKRMWAICLVAILVLHLSGCHPGAGRDLCGAVWKTQG